MIQYGLSNTLDCFPQTRLHTLNLSNVQESFLEAAVFLTRNLKILSWTFEANDYGDENITINCATINKALFHVKKTLLQLRILVSSTEDFEYSIITQGSLKLQFEMLQSLHISSNFLFSNYTTSGDQETRLGLQTIKDLAIQDSLLSKIPAPLGDMVTVIANIVSTASSLYFLELDLRDADVNKIQSTLSTQVSQKELRISKMSKKKA